MQIGLGHRTQNRKMKIIQHLFQNWLGWMVWVKVRFYQKQFIPQTLQCLSFQLVRVEGATFIFERKPTNFCF